MCPGDRGCTRTEECCTRLRLCACVHDCVGSCRCPWCGPVVPPCPAAFVSVVTCSGAGDPCRVGLTCWAVCTGHRRCVAVLPLPGVGMVVAAVAGMAVAVAAALCRETICSGFALVSPHNKGPCAIVFVRVCEHCVLGTVRASESVGSRVWEGGGGHGCVCTCLGAQGQMRSMCCLLCAQVAAVSDRVFVCFGSSECAREEDTEGGFECVPVQAPLTRQV